MIITKKSFILAQMSFYSDRSLYVLGYVRHQLLKTPHLKLQGQIQWDLSGSSLGYPSTKNTTISYLRGATQGPLWPSNLISYIFTNIPIERKNSVALTWRQNSIQVSLDFIHWQTCIFKFLKKQYTPFSYRYLKGGFLEFIETQRQFDNGFIGTKEWFFVSFADFLFNLWICCCLFRFCHNLKRRKFPIIITF